MTAGAAVAHVYATRRYFPTSSGPTTFLHDDIRTAWTPAWQEMLTGLQWLRLLRSAVYRGEGVPRGDGSPVLLVQGFLTRSVYLETLRARLERIGYRTGVADLGWGADATTCSRNASAPKPSASPKTSAAVCTWSATVSAACSCARPRTSRTSSPVTSLATPIRGLRVHPGLRLSNLAARAVVHRRRGDSVFPDCMTFVCECTTVRALATPLPPALPQLAIVARDDGVADWRYEADAARTRVVEVPSRTWPSCSSPPCTRRWLVISRPRGAPRTQRPPPEVSGRVSTDRLPRLQPWRRDLPTVEEAL